MKKGFTLLELLAVIVVLAIIALIVTPFVTNAINTAKKESFKNSMYGLIESAELYSGSKMTKNDFSETIVHSLNGTELSGLNFKYKGKSLKDVYLQINDKGKIRLLVWDDGLCAKKDFEESEVTVTKVLEQDCSLTSLNAPVISGGSEEWGHSRTITVVAEPSNLELDHYQYYLSTSGNGVLSEGRWVDLPSEEEIIKSIVVDATLIKDYENSDNENFATDLIREYYVYFRGVDTNNKNGLVSNVQSVKIDNTQYGLTWANALHGSLQVKVNNTLVTSPATVSVGDVVSLEANLITAYELKTLTYNEINCLDTKTFTMPAADTTIVATSGIVDNAFTYDGGEMEITFDDAGNWLLTLKSSGNLKFGFSGDIDVFAVGSGGGGSSGSSIGNGGGGGGYTETEKGLEIDNTTTYNVTVAPRTNPATNGTTSSFHNIVTAPGGQRGNLNSNSGGNGGSAGGAGSSYAYCPRAGASNGGSTGAGLHPHGFSYNNPATGQTGTTYSFEESTSAKIGGGVLYAGGGGGGMVSSMSNTNNTCNLCGGGSGGTGGGGNGGYYYSGNHASTSGVANTGGGGGGGGGCESAGSGGYGGSGIILIRNAQ